LVKLIHLPSGHSAEQLRLSLSTAVAILPEHTRLTLTWDQGSEMAQHDQIAEHFREGVFLARPGSPWRGSNENMNGLLRQYFPKGSDLSIHSLGDLHAVEEKLNNRPRKTLEWDTPATVFNRHATLIT
jgi:IS30 family transposase